MNTTIEEISLKVKRIQESLEEKGLQNILIRSIPNTIYLTGSVIQGYLLVDKDLSLPLIFLERTTNVLEGYPTDLIFNIRKPELIPDLLAGLGKSISSVTALELGFLPVTDYQRLSKLSIDGKVSEEDGSAIMREIRSVKTPQELTDIRREIEVHMEIYRLVPELFKRGMTDKELQHLLEFQMRRRGSIGIFRCFGARMESFMGHLLTGDNADVPAPYDFALGGKGDFAMPMGATGIEILPGTTVMVDLAGNFGTFVTDITRTYYLGDLPKEVVKAHQLSIELNEWFAEYAKDGAAISEVYNHFVKRVEEEEFTPHFMGYTNQVKFVGHGFGIEINEPPVLTARYKGVFKEGMTIAVEPKFVFPGIGAVGIENSYIIGRDGAENLSPLPTELISLTEE